MALLNNPQNLILALVGGVLPSLIWLWFWMRENKDRPEPKGILLICFLVGMGTVIFVLPIEKLLESGISNKGVQIALWAATEELFKFIATMLIVYKTSYLKEPLDCPIFFITTALGFAAFENTLFLIKPLVLSDSTISILTSELRFLGSTLLHATASGLIGIAYGLSLKLENKFKRRWHIILGIIGAFALHGIFNFFIMKQGSKNFLSVFAFLWVVTIINLLLFEKVRRLSWHTPVPASS